MSLAHQTRLPLRPLLGAARADSVSDLARRIGVPIRRAQDWSTNGIPLYRADDLAARLGYHPAELWPEWWTTPDYAGGYVHPSTIDPTDPFTTDQEQTA